VASYKVGLVRCLWHWSFGQEDNACGKFQLILKEKLNFFFNMAHEVGVGASWCMTNL
jgi:hypothetical protein